MSCTVRQAATRACPITWPPNTRCQPCCGERPRNRFTSIGSRSRMARRSWTADVIGDVSAGHSQGADRRLRRRLQSRPRTPRSQECGGCSRCPWRAFPNGPSRRFTHGAGSARNGSSRSVAPSEASDVLRATFQTEVLIAGGGFAGLALALALRQALGPRFAVTLVDPVLARGEDPRASAIAAAPRRMFEALGVWAAVAAQAQPILDMVITDSRVDDAVRPVFLTFEGEIEPGEPFAHMIENARLVAELATQAAAAGVTLLSQPVKDFTAGRAGVAVELGDGSTFTAKLLVAADGGRSRLR